MVKKIKETIKTYSILGFVIVGIAVAMLQFIISSIIISSYNLQEASAILLVKIMVPIGLYLGWGYLFFANTREARYRILTGRKYGSDHARFNRSYSELVRYFKDADSVKLDDTTLPTKSWKESSGLIFGKVHNKLVSFEPKRNGIVAMIWGAPGDGKTTSTIITSARQFGMTNIDGAYKQLGAVMVTDLKGDIYSANKEYRNIKRFSTINWKESSHYDPLKEARLMDEEDRAIYLENLAVTLIPQEASSDASYWTNGAREWFVGIMLFELFKSIDISFPEVCRKISIASYQEFGADIEASNCDIAKGYTNHYRDENEKNVSGCYSKLVENTRLYYNSKALREILTNDSNCISTDDLESCIDIYIQVDPTEMATIGGKIIAMIYQSFMAKMLKRQEGQNPPIAFIIDEFGQIPAMPVISQSAALMRAYNCSMMFSCQSLSMIDKHYGIEGRKLLLDCTKVHCFLSIMDPDTRDWASKLIGTKKELSISNSIQHSQKGSTGRSVSEVRTKIFEPESFGILPDEKALIIYYFGHYIKATKTYYFE